MHALCGGEAAGGAQLDKEAVGWRGSGPGGPPAVQQADKGELAENKVPVHGQVRLQRLRDQPARQPYEGSRQRGGQEPEQERGQGLQGLRVDQQGLRPDHAARLGQNPALQQLPLLQGRAHRPGDHLEDPGVRRAHAQEQLQYDRDHLEREVAAVGDNISAVGGQVPGKPLLRPDQLLQAQVQQIRQPEPVLLRQEQAPGQVPALRLPLPGPPADEGQPHLHHPRREDLPARGHLGSEERNGRNPLSDRPHVHPAPAQLPRDPDPARNEVRDQPQRHRRRPQALQGKPQDGDGEAGQLLRPVQGQDAREGRGVRELLPDLPGQALLPPQRPHRHQLASGGEGERLVHEGYQEGS
mmetsp:Transcript_8654/g.14659  ORF Transcript_8654/g.14659 Transcript_8654/m.14659 type:complete len:354 (+) Transcript_8654:402-1463(+)